MAIQFSEMKNITSDNAVDNKYDSISNNLKAGTEIKIDGIEHIFMKEDDILGVLE
jgi:co-chaperonin GroES (HSP10)